ncbi:MAG TPA: GNAT family N-acetyltransferase [Acidimicrobiales bacterium]|nr:GNAT family N-acetyltransferase [Acidimicrobiales bacterium]
MTAAAPAIRPWTPDDRAAVLALILDVQRNEFDLPITADDQPDLADVDGFYRGAGGEFWVAVDGTTRVGTIATLDIGDGRLVLRKLFVARSHRGDAGLGGRLLATLLAWAGRRSADSIWLGTTAVMTAAHRFYEKHGFARVDATELPAAFPRMAVDTVFYVRTLGRPSNRPAAPPPERPPVVRD